jgi:hypothetical protein
MWTKKGCVSMTAIGPSTTWQTPRLMAAFASEAGIRALSADVIPSAHAAGRSRLPDLVHQPVLADIDQLDRNVVHLAILIMFKAGLDLDRNPLALLCA